LRSLIAYGAHPYPIGPVPSEMIQEDVRLLREGMQAWVAMLERAGVFEEYPDPSGRRARLLAADPDALIAAISALYEHGGGADALPDMSMPCLILLAERETAQLELARRAAAEMPRAQVISVPDVGHAMAHARVIMPHVEPFLAALRAEDQGRPGQ
jgi:pimeloyl-ACP methyl ester carboxylesterase